MTPEKALNLIAGQCSKKECCTADIRQKLLRWELPEEDIARILDYLLRHRFVDDDRFARIYAEDKFRFNCWGRQKIALMLRRKGIPSATVEAALAAIPSDSYADSCLDLLRQKLRSLSEPDPYKLRAKLARFALSRGFDYDTVRTCLEQLLAGDACDE